MAVSGIPIIDESGATDQVAVVYVTINGINYAFQGCLIADPVSGAIGSVTPAGTNGTYAIAAQGIEGGVPLPVNVQSNGSQTSNITQVQVGTTTTSLLNANALRIGVIIYNAGTSDLFIAYGPTAALNLYSIKIAPEATEYIDTIPWRGPLSAIVGAPPDGSVAVANVMVTELTP